jgi:hypothetical protein
VTAPVPLDRQHVVPPSPCSAAVVRGAGHRPKARGRAGVVFMEEMPFLPPSWPPPAHESERLLSFPTITATFGGGMTSDSRTPWIVLRTSGHPTEASSLTMDSEAISAAATRFSRAWDAAMKHKVRAVTHVDVEAIEVHEAALALIVATGTDTLREALEVLRKYDPWREHA